MLNRRSFLLSGALVTAAAVLSSGRAGAQSQPAYLLGATAITQVFGDGQRLVAVALRYDGALAAVALDPTLYAVDGRTILRVHACASANPADENTDGPFVVLALSPEDDAARLYRLRQGGGTLRLPAAASVTLTPKDVPPPNFGPAKPKSETGHAGGGPPAFGSEPLSVATNDVRNLVVDDFVQHEFHDPATGDTLAYNLFVPRDRDPAVPLPLVLFMHDAGVTGPVVDTTLVQGLGAVSWASPEDQARHPCIVLAPQYRAQIVNDASQTTSMLDTTLHLLDAVARKYGADPKRLHATGQSGGGMMAIAMMIREPERFASAFLVACQWDATLVAPLARQKLWVVVSEGDEKAFPGQNAIMDVVARQGGAVSRAVWDGTSSPDAFASAVAAQCAENAPVNYSVLRRGTVVPQGQADAPGANHMNTWRIAYAIPSIRDWILQQTLEG